MQDIKIIPIFDQSAPSVWEDFARICSSTMLTNYNSRMTADEIQDSIDRDRKKWGRGTHFAFGAFADNEMVGFIQGTARGRCATIQSLYVLHDFQKMKVGRGLLQSAERATALFANRVELISLAKAEPFYRAHGYRTQYGTNAYEKNKMESPRCVCAPVFRCNRAMELKIQKLDSRFSADMVNKQHLPVFAYFNVDSKVIGFSVGQNMVVDPRCGMPEIVSRSLQYHINRTR